MPLTNAEKQRRFRERKVIVLTQDAVAIAGQLIEQTDVAELAAIVKKLRKVASFVADHVAHPDRTYFQQQIAFGRAVVGSLNGPLPKLAAIAAAGASKPTPQTRR